MYPVQETTGGSSMGVLFSLKFNFNNPAKYKTQKSFIENDQNPRFMKGSLVVRQNEWLVVK
jgi:hypothetical protein